MTKPIPKYKGVYKIPIKKHTKVRRPKSVWWTQAVGPIERTNLENYEISSEAILEILNATGQPSGYEKAKATAESLRPETEDEEEVNLDDIPF